MISKRRLGRKLDGAFVPHFQLAALLLIDKCYREADSFTRNALSLHPRIVPWSRPLIRRSIIQSQLFDLAEKYRPKLEPEWRTTARGGNEYVFIQGGDFVITEAKINEPGLLPVEAAYRATNSGLNYSLFPEGKKGGTFYGIIAHVPHTKEPRPIYVSIIFPDLNYSRVIHSFDILERFGSHLMRSQIEETQEANPQPTLREAGVKSQEAGL